MTNITDIDQLQARVQELEKEQKEMWIEMRTEVKLQVERFKPANIIKNAFSGVTNSIDSESDILKEGAALASGLIANAIMSGSKNKPLKRWVTLAIFSAATYLITKYQDEIMETGQKLMQYVSDRIERFKEQRQERRAERDEEEE